MKKKDFDDDFQDFDESDDELFDKEDSDFSDTFVDEEIFDTDDYGEDDFYDDNEPEPEESDLDYEDEVPEGHDGHIYYYKDEDNYEEEMLLEETEDEEPVTKKKKPLWKKILIGFGCAIGALVLLVCFLLFTDTGRRLGLGCVGKFLHNNMITEDEFGDDTDFVPIELDKDEIVPSGIEGGTIGATESAHRSEDYVKTFLIFGIEEIGGASNTDAIMLVSINKKDGKIKLTSLLRDTYVDIPGYFPNKLNSAYARGAYGATTSAEAKKNGAALLIEVIENTYDVDISGYACVNFESFEKIVDRLGGIDIELGKTEAAYLNKTNYISNPSNRCVSAGWNHLNGNQVLGYCRVRKVVTLGGANNDYGRTVRQRRVINAIISKFKSSSLLDMIPIMQDCLSYIYTNLTEDQITDTLVDVIDNSIFETESMRLPTDELFSDSGKTGIYNGSKNITYALVMGDHHQENIDKFHQFLFLDEEEQQTTPGADASSQPATATAAPVDEALPKN